MKREAFRDKLVLTGGVAGFLFVSAFLLFLERWGDPEWFSDVPLSTAYRAMDMLQYYSLGGLFYFSVRLWGMEDDPGTRGRLLLFLGCFSFVFFSSAAHLAGVVWEDARDVAWTTAHRYRSVVETMYGFLVIVPPLYYLTRGSSDHRVMGTVRRGAAYFLVAIMVFRYFSVFLPPVAHLSGLLHSTVLLSLSILFLVVVFLPYLKPVTQPLSIDSIDSTFCRNFGITAREREVMERLVRGYTNEQIAESLFVSVATVKTHLRHVYSKTGTRNRLELFARLHQQV